MGIRETLNEKPGVTTAVTAGVVVLALIYIVYSMWPRSYARGIVPQEAFYTTDLGATYAAKSTDTLYELDEQGKASNVRAWVYQWPGESKPFVAFLERVTPEVARAHPKPGAPGEEMDAMAQLMAEGDLDGHYVAPPGQDQWFEKGSPQGQQISAPPQRDGKYAIPVDPGD